MDWTISGPRGSRERRQSVSSLSGGLNLLDHPLALGEGECPEIENLRWRDGVLSCRDGQEQLTGPMNGPGLGCCPFLFWGYALAHIGSGLYAGRPGKGMQLQLLYQGLEPVRGTFVRFGDALLYKTKGAFLSVTYDPAQGLSAAPVEPYVPVILINCSPQGAGDLYQPENRLSSKKTVWYHAQRERRTAYYEITTPVYDFQVRAADGEPVLSVEQVAVDGAVQSEGQYQVDREKWLVRIFPAPNIGAHVAITYTVGVRRFRLPVEDPEAVTAVEVDGKPVTAFTLDRASASVLLDKAPPVHDPPAPNTVRITFQKANPQAEAAIQDCRYACAYGGSGEAALVLAGSEAQPNAYFWSGSHVAADPGYFPMAYYNLAGDSLDPVTGFGQQAGFLVLFQARQVGRCRMTTVEVEGRAMVTLDYTPVNSVLGCDLPWTIRMVENNLLWCSTYAGVCRLEDTTAALENQVRCLSRKVNGSSARPGLLAAVRSVPPDQVAALEDGQCYAVAAGGTVFLWDHTISLPGNPSWFRYTQVPAVDFFRGDRLQDEGDGPFTGPRRIYHLDRAGRISRFARTYRDYGKAIYQRLRLPAMAFGTAEWRKSIRKATLVLAPETPLLADLTYETDQEVWGDPVPIDWEAPALQGQKLVQAAVRRPICRRVQYFSMEVSCNRPGDGLAVISATVSARLMGDER